MTFYWLFSVINPEIEVMGSLSKLAAGAAR